MATYLQGVTDYIPQIQPFQPNLNLFNEVLNVKQTRYDQNYKAINDIYGKFFYSNLTRENNIERKDEVLKNIEFNLNKVSALDLSLEQNVTQAKQLFKPFYEDNYLMKDMAWTKNYINQRNKAATLQNSKDEKERAMYWETGIKDLDYSREEFKEATDDESLGFGNVSYTPYVNVNKAALDIAKKANLQIETVDFSPDGRWIIKNRNGEVLKKPLSQLFEAQLANDPAVQAVYRVQSRVNRKDYARTNAAQFNGDVKAAEMDYLQKNYENLARQTKYRYLNLADQNLVTKNQIAEIEKKIASGKALPGAQQRLRQLQQSQEINEAVLSRVENLNDQLNGPASETATTNNGFRNPYGDLESLRAKVDAGVASSLMYKDLNEAAETFAYMNAKTDIEANPYKVMEIKQANTMAAIAKRGEIQEKLLNKKIEADRITNILKIKEENKNEYFKDLAEKGLGTYDINGNFVPNEQFFQSYSVEETRGNVTDELNQLEVSRTIMNENYNEIDKDVLKPVLNEIKQLRADKRIDDAEISKILDGMSYDDFVKDYNKKSDDFKNKMQDDFIKIANNWDEWINENKDQLPNPDTYFEMHNNRMVKVNAYEKLRTKHNEWMSETRAKVKQSFINNEDVKDYIEDLSDGIPNLDSNTLVNAAVDAVSEEDFKRKTNFEQRLPDLDKLWNEYYFNTYGENYRRPSGSQPEFAKLTWTAQKLRSLGFENTTKDTYNRYRKDFLGLYTKISKVSNDVWSKEAGSYPILPAYGVTPTTDGTFTKNSSAIMVSTSTPSVPGGAAWRSFMDDMNRIKIDGVNTQISFEGGTQTGIENFDKDLEADQKFDKIASVESLLNYIYNKGLTENLNFQMKYNSIAKNKFGKESMTISVDKDILDEWGSLKEDSEEVFGPEDTRDILNNGITIIADDGVFQNSLAKTSQVSILEKAVDLSGDDGYTLVDKANPNNSITFKKDKLNDDYDFSIKMDLSSIGGGIHEENEYGSLPLGNTLDQQAANVFHTFNDMNNLINYIDAEGNLDLSNKKVFNIINNNPVLQEILAPQLAAMYNIPQ